MYTSYALLLHLMSPSQLPASDDIPRLWPQPASYTNGTTALTLDASAFSIAVSPDAHSSAASANDALAWNVAFYSKEIFSRPADPECANTLDDPTALPLHRLTITLDKREGVGAPFTLGADESYTLALGSPNATLHAATQWGAIRGLETFSQLLQMNRGFAIRNGNGVRIVDSPRFPWRGLMLDPARHFLRVEEITATIDAMAQCKLNALHLHLTDGESFTVRTTEWLGTPFANLSRFGAFAPRLTYSKADLTAIVEHARLRGVRVIPEFDLPAHMASWSLGHPSLITSCPSVNPHPEWPTYYSPADVTSPSLYSAIDAVLTNLAPVFTDNFWHVGGDEPHFACWEANEEVMAWAKVHGNLSSVDLYAIFESRYAAAVRAHGKMVIGWEEIQTLTAPLAEKHPEWIPLRNSTVVHVWEGNAALAAIVAAGYPAIVSSKWYLNNGGDWSTYYSDDPTSYLYPNATAAQKKLVMGGSACMWNSAFDANSNMEPAIWPNAAAMAEQLWSKSIEDATNARTRLSQHRCRMVRRGVHASPIAEDYCDASLYVRKSNTFATNPNTPPP